MKFSLAILMISLLVGLPSFVRAETSLTAQEILAASDAIRNPDKPFSVKVHLIEYRQGIKKDEMILSVYSKEEQTSGQYRNLIRFLEPMRDANKLMLKNGNVLWFYDPTSKAAVRISPQQRLLGQAANGDVVTINFHKDYIGSLENDETITDAEKNTRICYKIKMVANKDSVTYHHIEYWVDKRNFQPVKGKYYSESGRLLKIAYTRNFQNALGNVRPTETIIIDGVNHNLITKMTYSEYNYQDIPEDWFQKEYLQRFLYK